MKLILDSNSVQDRNIFKDLIKPHIRYSVFITELFRGLRQNSKLIVQNSLRTMGVEIIECYSSFCTFKTLEYEIHIEQAGLILEVEINSIGKTFPHIRKNVF